MRTVDRLSMPLVKCTPVAPVWDIHNCPSSGRKASTSLELIYFIASRAAQRERLAFRACNKTLSRPASPPETRCAAVNFRLGDHPSGTVLTVWEEEKVEWP